MNASAPFVRAGLSFHSFLAAPRRRRGGSMRTRTFRFRRNWRSRAVLAGASIAATSLLSRSVRADNYFWQNGNGGWFESIHWGGGTGPYPTANDGAVIAGATVGINSTNTAEAGTLTIRRAVWKRHLHPIRRGPHRRRHAGSYRSQRHQFRDL